MDEDKPGLIETMRRYWLALAFVAALVAGVAIFIERRSAGDDEASAPVSETAPSSGQTASGDGKAPDAAPGASSNAAADNPAAAVMSEAVAVEARPAVLSRGQGKWEDASKTISEALDRLRDAAARAGLDVHVTVMFGYPWEGETEVRNTVALARTLLRKGDAYTLQVTRVVPYPGTPLFRELDAQGLLLTRDWDEYDMRTTVMRCPLPEEAVKGAVRQVYKAFLHPETIARRLFSTRNPVADFMFYWRGFRSLVGHLRDFT